MPDVLSRQQVEQALQESEERLRLAVAAAHIGIFDFDLLTGHIEWSDQHEALWGYAPGEFPGTREGFESRVHPEDLERVKAQLQACIEARRPFDHELRVIWPDGSIHWVQVLGEFSFDAAGAPVRLRGVALETTLRKHAEDAVRGSERRLRNLIDGFGPSILAGLMTPDGTIIEVNRSALRALGLRSEDLIGQRLEQISAWGESAAVRQQLRESIKRAAQGVASRYDLQIFTATGMALDLDFSLEPVRDESGRVIYLVPSGSVITERKRAERHVRELNRVYALLSDVNQAIVREKDPAVLLSAACRIAIEKGGFLMAWIGMLDPSIGRLRIEACHGAEPQTLDIVRSLVTGDNPQCEFTYKALHDGVHAVCDDIATDPRAAAWRAVALMRGYRSMAALPLTRRGVVGGTFNLYSPQVGFFDREELALLDEMAMDISFALDVHERDRERFAVEKALGESEYRFRQLAENIDEIFWTIDGVRRAVLYVSPAYETITGRTCASLYESPSTWWDAVHPEDRRTVEQAYDEVLRGGTFDETFRISRPDGSIRWIHARAFPVREGADPASRVVGVSEDITDRRQLEEQYRQAQKMEAIGQLAGGVAHDFNNLLVIIQGFASLLTEENLTADGAESVRQITQAASRASNLTRQLLAFSRRQVMQRQHVDLNLIVENLHSMLLRIVGEDVRLRVSLADKPLLTHADSSQIDQIILNLVVNSRDAMSGGGEISLETTERTLSEQDVEEHVGARAGRFVCLRVGDTGSGIPAQDLPHIFEPFFTTKSSGKGTGLGLSTVYGIVTQHGGSVRVMSEVDRGTTFEIYLPASDAEPAPTAPWPSESKASRGTETILVVEDDPDVRKLTCSVLSRQGYRILEASRAAEALELWDREGGNVDLLLTDMIMPGGMSGRELANRLRERKPDLRIVLTSGYSPEIAGSEVCSPNGERFIQKPAPIAELLQIVRRCLDDPSAVPPVTAT